MLGRCPCCGTSASLEMFLGDDDAAKAIVAALKLTPVGRQLVKYLGLFRPEKKTLSMAKVAKLLAEVTPMIEQQRIKRDGVDYSVSVAIFEKSITAVIEARDAGRLQTPLKSHGYLLEVIISELAKAEKEGVQAEHARKERERKDNERKVEQMRRDAECRVDEQARPRDTTPMPDNIKQAMAAIFQQTRPEAPALTTEQKESRKHKMLEDAKRLKDSGVY